MKKEKRTKAPAVKKKKTPQKTKPIVKVERETLGPAIEEDFLQEEEKPETETVHDAGPDTPKGSQPFLFGEADMILNTLETEKKEWSDRYEKLMKASIRVGDKAAEAQLRIVQISSAIEATKKHAPMSEDPAPPKKVEEEMAEAVKETVKELTKDSPLTDEEIGKAVDEAVEEIQEEEESEEISFRQARGPTVPEILKVGETIMQHVLKKTYRVELIEGPFYQAQIVREEGAEAEIVQTPGHFKLSVSTLDAPRIKSGQLSKGYKLLIIPFLVGVDGRILCIFKDSELEISSTLPKGEAENSFKKVSHTVEEEMDEEEEEEDKEADKGMF